MPVLGNGAIRGSKKQLHKLEDFLGAVLSKEESEGKRHGRKKFPCCSLLPDSAGLDRVSPANAGRAGYASPSLNLPRNTGTCVGHFREVPSLEPGYWIRSDQIRSVAQSCPTLCGPMNRSTPGLPVHHQLPEFTETHVHRVSDAIQPSHPLSSPSPLAPNPSQHQSLFQ